ncbi:MAG TPA: L,D-transpeptidase family protein [Mariprofundaceae bacterium]|nr:L,D-transpeptidase family protein [Mariprofundaceae bacterium]
MNRLCKGSSIFLAALLAATAAHAMGDDNWSRAREALDAGDSDLVKQMPEHDLTILKATVALKSGQPEEALKLLGNNVDQDPLAALLGAEAHRQEAVRAVETAGSYARDVQQQSHLLASADLSAGLGEADARLHAFLDKLDSEFNAPLDLLQLGPEVRNVFMVDKGRNRLFIFDRQPDGSLHKVADEYVVTGASSGDKTSEGDGKTPNGIYRFVKRLEGKSLEAKYGPVAFPIDYPNELDSLHHKNGHGIWLHGYPLDVERRPPRDTKGCFALPNNKLLAVADEITLGKSWVIVGRDFAFNQPAEQQDLLQSVENAIESWRKDWASLDTDAYLSHYHAEFRSGKYDLAGWKRYKERVNAGKTSIDVSFSDLTIIHDPSPWPEGEVVVAEFKQHYRSNNYADETRKRLYLARAGKDAPWKVLIEETIEP